MTQEKNGYPGTLRIFSPKLASSSRTLEAKRGMNTKFKLKSKSERLSVCITIMKNPFAKFVSFLFTAIIIVESVISNN